MILRIPNFFFFCLTFSCSFATAQFNNTLENDKARPILTPSEAEMDSLDFKGPALTCKDRATNFTHWVWTGFDKYKSQSGKDSSYIFYSRTQGAAKPTVDMRISAFPGDCRNGDQTVKASAPVVGPAGEVYLCWAGPKGLSFQCSLDSGVTWFSREKIIVPIINGWNQKVDGVTLDCTPRMAVDQDGAYKGRIYIIWSDEKNSEKNKDVFLVYSDNRGENWTEPILLSYRPNHKEQFQPQIAVQPGTGKLFVTYFDKQNYHEQKGLVDLYLGLSVNGGLKFDFYRLNQERILLDSNIASVRGLVFIPRTEDAKIVWTQMTEGGRLHFYSVLLNDTAIKGYVAREQEMEMVLPKTINYSANTEFDFTLKKESKITVVATKPLDPKFSLEILKDTAFPAGSNHINFNLKKLGLKKDNYILTFYYNGRNSSLWMLR